MEIKVKIKELLEKHKLTQTKLSEMSGVPAATLSDLVRDKRTSINKDHLVAIAKVFDITDIRELIDFETEGDDDL